MPSEQVFAEYRPLLFTIAYEILGSAADAEDVLQDSYIRWSDTESTVTNPRAYLARIVTRQALNHLRTAQRRREQYVGPWLPEPIRTEPDTTEDTVLAESVSVAMLLVLETLGPDERAVFVLHEVFGYTYPEIADMIGKTDPTVRQIAHRAREHVQARRKRFDPAPDTTVEIVTKFFVAAREGDIQTLMDLMSPDVVQISDGGGRVSTALRPILGQDHVARFLAGIAKRDVPDVRIEFATFNSLPAVLAYSGDQPDTLFMIELADRLVRSVYIVRNPDKLRAAAAQHPLAR